MEEPLLAEHRARGRDTLGALGGDPSAARAAPNPHKEEDGKSPLQPHHEEEAKKPPLEAHEERDAGNLQGNELGAAPSPRQEEDAQKTPLELLDAEKSQPNKEDGSLKPPSQESAPVSPSQEPAPVNTSQEPPPASPSQESPPVNTSQEPALNRDKKTEVEKNRDKKIQVEKQTLASLRQQAREFAQCAAGTSMAAAADSLCSAADKFARGKDRKKKVIETDLNQAAMMLSSVAEAAPISESRLAARAIDLTGAVQMILLSDIKPEALAGWWRWRRASSTSCPGRPRRPSLKERLRAAILPRELRLPIYMEREKQLVDKREVLYALALAAPVAILTAAAGLKLFEGDWAIVAGISAGVWVLAASGMVLNQYGVFDWELLAARHFGRLGILGAAVLFCLFSYRAFFPSTLWALKLLLIITAVALGLPWILSCVRGDDMTLASAPPRRHTI